MMALRPSKQHVPIFTEEEVIMLRKWFYEDNQSYTTIQSKLSWYHHKDVSVPGIRKAIKGIGKFYSSIKDDIPQEYKDERLREPELDKALQRYCILVSRGMPHKQALIKSGMPERFTQGEKDEWKKRSGINW